MEPSRDDVEVLLLHYKLLRGDVNLLMQFCGHRNRTLLEGFRDVIEQIADLEKQLKEWDAVHKRIGPRGCPP